MRTLYMTLAVGLALVGSVSGGTITRHYGLISGSASERSGPYSIVLEVLRDSNPLTIWRVDGITPDDSGGSWRLDESNAVAFNVDWPVLESALLKQTTDMSRGRFFHTDRIPHAPNSGWRWIGTEVGEHEFYTIDHVDFNLTEWVTTSFDSLINYNFSVVGEGRIIPEPSTITLLLPLALLLGLGQRRKVWPW